MTKRKKQFNRKEVRELVISFAASLIMDLRSSDESRKLLLNTPERGWAEVQWDLYEYFSLADTDHTVFGERHC